MKALNLGKISAALFAATALGAGTLALPASAGEATRSTDLAQYEGLGSCRVINVASADVWVFEDGLIPTDTTLFRGAQVRLVEANQNIDGIMVHRIAYPVGGMGGAEEFGYIEATMGAFDSSTLAYCADASTRPGAISETCDDGIIDIPSGGNLDLVSSVETDEYIVNMFDNEPVTILDANVVASDGTLYHYIIDSAGNRGYVRAVVNGMPAVRCGFSVTW